MATKKKGNEEEIGKEVGNEKSCKEIHERNSSPEIWEQVCRQAG